MRKYYSEEIRKEVLQHYSRGEKVKKLSIEYNISKSTIYSWIHLYRIIKMGDGTLVTAKDYYDLKKEHARLQIDYLILRECSCKIDSELGEKLIAISKLDGEYPIHALCRVLGVRRSTYYHYKFRRPEQTEIEKQDLILKPIIREIFIQTKGRIGSKKICYLMRKKGYNTSAGRIRRLMKEMNLVCRTKMKRANYNYSKSSLHCKDLLKQDFDQKEPNKVWVTDITYVRVNRKAYYLCVIIDLFSRKVIAYNTDDNQGIKLVSETFLQAYHNRNPEGGLILHSDQGMQYKSEEFRWIIREKEFESSFSRAGCPYDNAVAEAFFRMFKQEEANHIYYKTPEDFKASVDEYICFFNNERPHEKLGNLTPSEKEEIYFNTLKEVYRYSSLEKS